MIDGFVGKIHLSERCVSDGDAALNNGWMMDDASAGSQRSFSNFIEEKREFL